MREKTLYRKMDEIFLVKEIDQLELFYKQNAIKTSGKDIVTNKNRNVWRKDVQVEESSYYWKGKPILIPGKLKNNKKPIVVELFCGCGGTSYGFKMAGYEIVLGLDIHTPSILSFKKNHIDAATLLGDVKKISPLIIKDYLGDQKVDVLIAGVPCQGFSLNNRKRHHNDERNFLYKEFIRFLKVLEPRAVILENVVGLRTTSNGEFALNIEREISEVGDMKVNSSVLFAPDYGVPQRRSRLVFVGIRGKNEFDFESIVKTNGPDAKKDYVTVHEAIADLPRLKAGEEDSKYISAPFSEYQNIMRKKSNSIIYNHRAPNHPLKTIEKIGKTMPGSPMYPKFKQRIRLAWEIQSPTQVSGGIRPQFQFGHPRDQRGLTIRERCRLQSFPDEFIVEGGIVQGRVQTGNAVPPLLAKALALALKRYL